MAPSAPSRCQLWLGLTRPRTLFSGLSSVLVALFYAGSLGAIEWVKALLLILVAVSAQIASNIANDLIDYKKGADTDERKGPLRPLSKGLLTEREVKQALYISLAALLISGMSLIALSSWWLLFIGGFISIGIFAYSGGPYPLSSFYILRGTVSDSTIWHLATAIGLASVNILVVNNYRDVEEDRKAGKQTLIVRMGKDFAPRLYLTLGLLSIGFLYPIFSFWGMLLLLPYVFLISHAHRSLQRAEGEELNKTLGETARNVFLLAILIGVMLLIRK